MIANKHSQNDTVGRTTNQSWISLPSFILSAIDSQKQRITAKFNKISNHHQYHISAIHLSRCICTYPYFSKPVRNMYQFYQSPSGPVHIRKTLQVFRIYKTVWFEHENISTIHGSSPWPQILSTIHGFFTLAVKDTIAVAKTSDSW